MNLLEMTLSGGVFALAIALFRMLALRRLPKQTFVALWWAAALRLLLPLKLPSRLSVYTLLELLRPQAEPAPVPSGPPVPTVPVAVPPQVKVIPTPTAAPASPPFPIWTVLWAAGAALLTLWFVVCYIRWQRRFRESLPADCPGVHTCFRFWRRVQLRVTDRIAAPLTYGLLRPVILLPKTLDLRDEEALTCVLAHEAAHIRHLDSLLKLVLTAALCLHWFNPVVWMFYVLANRDMELRCDEAAVLALGNDSRERYALTLIRLAEQKCVPLCGFSEKNGMEERIRAIMSIKKKSLAVCAAALAMVLGITTAFATSAKPREIPRSVDPTDAELYAQSSAETAAQWDELLEPYAAFGLKWSFDDPDLDGNGLTMTYEGREVRSISDEQTGVWITEHTGNGSYGPDALDLYTVYENGKLTGLRFATEEEKAAFDRERELSGGALTVENLVNSVRYDSGNIYFTIPEGEEIWSIFIQGRLMTEDGKGMSVHYLEEESERAEWVPRMTYSFEVADAAYDELTMDVRYGNATYFYDLTLLLPENGAPLAQEPLPEGKGNLPVGVTMIWPVDIGKITTPYGTQSNGKEHTGVDIGGMKEGTPIYAAASGTVIATGFSTEHGNYIRLDHGNGLETVYAHCRSIEVQTDAAVALGQTIATVGSTGQSTGPHLHFGILVNGENQDPVRYFEKAGVPEVQPGDEPRAGGAGADSALDAAKYYDAGSLPMFQLVFSRLSEKEQSAWLNKIYADGEIAFFSVSLDMVPSGSSLINSFAESVYQDGSISFFSVLTDRMSEKTLNTWLNRAVKEKKTSFQSVLFDKLGKKDELDALEEELEKQQLEEYRKVGVTNNGREYYYQGKLVNIFLDHRPDSSCYTLNMNPAGEINIKIIRGADGQVTGVGYITDSEFEELFGEST